MGQIVLLDLQSFKKIALIIVELEDIKEIFLIWLVQTLNSLYGERTKPRAEVS
jgi:hypothetical protein